MLTLRSAVTFVGLLLTVGVRAGAGQAPAVELGPTQIMEAFWRSLVSQRWAEAAGFLELTALDTYRRELVREARQTRAAPPLTVERLMRADPDMPREVAEYEVRRHGQRAKQPPSQQIPGFAGLDSMAQLERLSLEELGTRWVQGNDLRGMMKQQLAAQNCPTGSAMDSILAASTPRVIGSLQVSPDTAIAVFLEPLIRASDASYYADGVLTAYLLRTPRGWRIVPRQSLLGVAGMAFSVGCVPR